MPIDYPETQVDLIFSDIAPSLTFDVSISSISKDSGTH